MPANNHDSIRRLILARRRARVAELFLAGRTQYEIAEEVKVTQTTVSRDLSAIREDWMARASSDFAERRAEELAKIDRLELEYLDGWQRSKQIREKTHTRKKSRPSGRTTVNGAPIMEESLEAGVAKEQDVGDPRYLEGVRWCISERCRIIGLYAPKNIDMTSAGKPITFISFVGVRDDEDNANDEDAVTTAPA
jgi:hypothetical protein